MRVYLTREGTFVATLAEAGKDATRMDVPTDKPGLITFLNALHNATAQVCQESFADACQDAALESRVMVQPIPYQEKVRIMRRIRQLQQP